MLVQLHLLRGDAGGDVLQCGPWWPGSLRHQTPTAPLFQPRLTETIRRMDWIRRLSSVQLTIYLIFPLLLSTA